MNVIFFIKILLCSSYLREQKYGDFKEILPNFLHFLEKEEGNI
jgi:hypothetical protein